MKRAILAALAFAVTASAGTADLMAEIGPGFALGGWGSSFGTGLNMGLGGEYRVTPKLRVGASADISTFSHTYSGDASLFMFRPSLRAAFYLNPGSASFNPGIAVSLGMCRTALESGGGTDPSSWDPFWRAGVRWDLSLGHPWRAGLGFDLESVMASEKTGDTFRLVLSVSREVPL